MKELLVTPLSRNDMRLLLKEPLIEGMLVIKLIAILYLTRHSGCWQPAGGPCRPCGTREAPSPPRPLHAGLVGQ
jgi:hypothetical protein